MLTSFNEFLWGPSKEKMEKQTRDQVNESVANTQNTMHDLTVKRNNLEKRLKKLKNELQDEEADLNDVSMQMKFEEYKTCEAEMQAVDGVLANIKTVESATSKTVINVNAYNALKDAQKALSNVNSRVDPHDVERTNRELELDIDRSEELTRAVSSPIRHKPYVRNVNGAKQKSMQETIAQWKTQKMPTPVSTSGGGGANTKTTKVNVDVDKIVNNLSQKQDLKIKTENGDLNK
jgi:chromosome segregation ATPase